MKTATSSPEGWIKPGQLTAYQFRLWNRKYGASELDYRLHYQSACTGDHISVTRMGWLADEWAIHRLKGKTHAD